MTFSHAYSTYIGMSNPYAGSRLTQIGKGSYAGDATILYNNKAMAYPLASAGARHRNRYAIAQASGGLTQQPPKPQG